MINKTKSRVDLEELDEIHEIKRKILDEVDPVRKRQIQKGIRKQSLLFVIEVSFLAAILFVVYFFNIGIETVSGNSMYPTLHDKNLVIYSRKTTEYKQGDIVVLQRPDGKKFVKRIVAVAGDTVNIQNGKIYVNGYEYVLDGIDQETRMTNKEIENPVLVKEDEVYVLGDNRGNSEDSREFGVVRVEDLEGKLLYYIGKAD